MASIIGSTALLVSTNVYQNEVGYQVNFLLDYKSLKENEPGKMFREQILQTTKVHNYVILISFI